MRFVRNHVRITAAVFAVLLTSTVSPPLTPAQEKTSVQLKASTLQAEITTVGSFTDTKSSEYSQVRQVAVIGQKYTPTKQQLPEKNEWGVAKQIDEHTWTIPVGQDTKMGAAQEILSALNTYRSKKGVGLLAWDDRLGRFAQNRAEFFSREGKLDSHAGFREMMNNNGFEQMGFNALGENSSIGYQLEGVHLIEWVYAGDKPHNDNQLNAEWTHVGIGVSLTATDLVFGGRKR